MDNYAVFTWDAWSISKYTELAGSNIVGGGDNHDTRLSLAFNGKDDGGRRREGKW